MSTILNTEGRELDIPIPVRGREFKVAVITAQWNGAITGALREILPGYMIPNLFMQVDAMPLNKNGKIDRAALLEQYAAAKAAKKEARHG